MQEIDFQKLSFPRGLNLHLLSGFLSELELKEMIVNNCRKIRTARRIILPSKKLLKKVICHYLVKKYAENYDAVVADLKGDSRLLKNIGVDRKQIRQLYKQREKEIKKGR